MSDQPETPPTWAVVEELRPVAGFEGLYEVSENGRVRRVGRAHASGAGRGGSARLGMILKQRIQRSYPSVFLWRQGKQTTVHVHALVAAAFIGPRPDGMQINHIDGDKTNARASNLEYVTPSQNIRHAYATGLRKPSVEGSAAARRKPRRLVPCACGCGQSLITPDAKGRERKVINGHQRRFQQSA